MDKALFDQCIVKFNKIISNCHTYLDGLESKADIEALTLKQIQDLKKFCVSEHSQQDKIFSEVRHLLGMGNLSPVQTSQLIKCFKEYTSFRSDIKTIAMHLNSITDIPGIPTKAEYEITILGNFKLTSELRCGKEELATIIKESSDKSTVTTEPVASKVLGSKLELYNTIEDGCAIKYHDNTDMDILVDAIKKSGISGAANKTIKKKLINGGSLKNSKYELLFKKGYDDSWYAYMPHKINPLAKRAADTLINYLDNRNKFFLKH